MSGHSKWHNIQQRKGKQDSLRSNVFSKYAKQIMIVARTGGGNPEMNFSLRLLIDKAKAAAMPKDNIERAIKRGTGEITDGVQVEESLYEAFGPGGTAIIIKTLSDNKNRTVSDLKHILSQYGGSMGGAGSVMWNFEKCGLIIAETAAVKNREELEMKMIEAGADDIWEEEGLVYFKVKIPDLKRAVETIRAAGVEPVKSGIEWVAKDKVKVGGSDEERLKNLFGELEENDDVDDYWTNAE